MHSLWHKVDFKGVSGEGKASDRLLVNGPSFFQLECLQDASEEEKVVGSGNKVSRTAPLSQAEQDKLLIGDKLSGLSINEPLRPERLWTFKVIWVIMHDV